jgi:hypothetical protein
MERQVLKKIRGKIVVESTYCQWPLHCWASLILSPWKTCPPMEVEAESELWREPFLL